jgi:hypothetical protein
MSLTDQGCVIGPFIPKLGPTNRQLLIAITLMVASIASMAALSPTSSAAAIALQVLCNLPFHVIVSACSCFSLTSPGQPLLPVGRICPG